jgi:hypothetical protein
MTAKSSVCNNLPGKQWTTVQLGFYTSIHEITSGYIVLDLVAAEDSGKGEFNLHF